MNIFVTDRCPYRSAEHLDNKRVVKMVLESAQLLSTALHESGRGSSEIYKPTHRNHPCSVWVRSDWRNYCWLYEHFCALLGEYTRRYGKVHKSSELLTALMPPILDSRPPVSFVNCARHKGLGIDYTDVEDVFTAYRMYLDDRWDTDKRAPVWEPAV